MPAWVFCLSWCADFECPGKRSGAAAAGEDRGGGDGAAEAGVTHLRTAIGKTLPLPCVSTVFVAEPVPLPCASTVFVAKTVPLPCVSTILVHLPCGLPGLLTAATVIFRCDVLILLTMCCAQALLGAPPCIPNQYTSMGVLYELIC